MKQQYKKIQFTMEQILNEKTFTVPNFQRGIAWKDNKKRNFIKTLINGEPFGTILVYKNKNDLYIIDGLQRITTIRDFNKDKYKLLTSDILEDSEVKEIIRIIKKIYSNNTSNKSGEIADKLKFEKVKDYIFRKLQEKKGNVDDVLLPIKKYYKMSEVNDNKFKELLIYLRRIVFRIDKMVKINNLVIYGLEYTGEVSRLPDVFYNLNTGGTAPSKYEVFASLWNDIKYVINDNELISEANKRFDLLKKYNLEVTISQRNLKREGLTLFEYCYSLGKILYDEKRNFNSFIGEGKEGIEPLSFSLLCLILGLQENQTNQLGKKLGHVTAEFLVDLKDAILDCFELMYDALHGYTEAIRTTSNNKKIYNYTGQKYMIYHMFMACFNKKYEIDLAEGIVKKSKQPGIGTWVTGFKENAHLHYFYDFLTDFWTNHRQVSDLSREIKKDERLFKYNNVISEKDWNTALSNFKEEQLNVRSRQTDMKQKMFLEYLIRFKNNNDIEKIREYFYIEEKDKISTIDIEHIIPIAIIDGKNIGNSVPVYSLGNLCFLPSELNISKKEKTYYQYIKSKKGKPDSDFINAISYPTEEAIESFIHKSPSEFKEGYLNFVSNRLDIIIKEFKDNMQ